jgi:hypothetical protein
MALFKKEPQDRMCGHTWSLCTHRSGRGGGKPSIIMSNPHLCTDLITSDDRTHGKDRNNPHHCTACSERKPL